MTGPDPLAEGEIVPLGRFRDASNVTLLAEARLDEVVVRCVYKPIAGERPLWDFPEGTLAGREVAAFVVSESLGWSVVPRTLLREGPHGPGMVQEWVEAVDEEPVRVLPIDEVPAGFIPVLEGEDGRGRAVTVAHADSEALWRLAVFDVVINNADRKGGHVLATPHGTVVGVDHGVSFHSELKLRTVLWGFAGRAVPDALLADLRAWLDAPDRRSLLRDYLTDEEIEALVDRVSRVVADATMPLPRDRGPSIPWPPL
jgi:uncharacterized repeat protein (TIGR03843 family)